MKKTFEYLLPACFLAFLLFPYGCDKTQEPIKPDLTDTTPVDTPINHIIGLNQTYCLLNNLPWLGKIEAAYYKDDKSRFLLHGQVTYNTLKSEYLTIQDIPSSTGKYNVEKYRLVPIFFNYTPNANFSIVQDFDQGIGDYQIDTTRQDHFIEIIRFDTLDNIVEGRFQLFMPLDTPASNWTPAPPAYISITEGKFHLKIKEL